ncbi:MAG TPA: hypothetical protein PLR20_01510 [Syntrophales bacterium]|nr:hypothetical protein [Syntrophales bacterium]HOX93582.1 hypothetical protein [Syntrophales bacterium]HPI56877.1 hypothetical protein [Syntrophales bacterium]HPN23463.1 hypothetical protein [Syntrophales bacterium]HQM28012.1 hypothetical protein [Syntrophales bacterium]
MTNKTKEGEKFIHDNQQQIEQILTWVNSYVKAGDLENLKNAAISLQCVINQIVTILAACLPTSNDN